MGIIFNAGKEYKKANKYLNDLLYIVKNESVVLQLRKYGDLGVKELSNATPKDTGLTSTSWYYEIEIGEETTKIIWKNSNIADWAPIAILLQYGHATRNGGYVEGNDYINPAMEKVFKDIAEEAWKELKNA